MERRKGKGKYKIISVHVKNAYRGSRDIAPRTLTWALDGVQWSASCPGHSTPGENPGTCLMVSRLGLRDSLAGLENRRVSYPYRYSNSGPSSPYPGLRNSWSWYGPQTPYTDPVLILLH